MANRTVEMHHYRHALVRMRIGESDRQIAKVKIMGRRIAGGARREAIERGWLDTTQALPKPSWIDFIRQGAAMINQVKILIAGR